MLLRQDALRAEHHFHVVELLGKPQQQLDAARKGDGLECRKVGEQILPAASSEPISPARKAVSGLPSGSNPTFAKRSSAMIVLLSR
jgi:hypothetical protein